MINTDTVGAISFLLKEKLLTFLLKLTVNLHRNHLLYCQMIHDYALLSKIYSILGVANHYIHLHQLWPTHIFSSTVMFLHI